MVDISSNEWHLRIGHIRHAQSTNTTISLDETSVVTRMVIEHIRSHYQHSLVTPCLNYGLISPNRSIRLRECVYRTKIRAITGLISNFRVPKTAPSFCIYIILVYYFPYHPFSRLYFTTFIAHNNYPTQSVDCSLCLFSTIEFNIYIAISQRHRGTVSFRARYSLIFNNYIIYVSTNPCWVSACTKL